MKKQFFRVKQLADQTFSRAGKTDVLSDDLQEADKKVEYIKTSCQNVGKKLSACLLLGQLQGESATKEKLLKKSPEYQLGTTMLECSAICEDDSLMRIILSKSGNAEKTLAEENAEHDHRVEQYVVTPLQNVLENDIPSIVKTKKNVTKVCLDMDSAKARYQQAQKHNSSNTTGTAKVESIKDELEDCEQKVEQSRDVLACEMFHLAARESELCHTMLQYYKLLRAYHEYALHVLDKLIPELESDLCASSVKPIYGEKLEEHLRVTDRRIAFPIELCICALLELGMEEEGLFRIAGGASKVKRMKLSFDAGCMTLSTAFAYKDPHVIAGALKSYLRELPEPLLTHDLYDEWLTAVKGQAPKANKLQALWTVVHKLPQANYDNLCYLIKFFHLLSKNHEVNKMSPHNIAIVIAPSLIWAKQDFDELPDFGININAATLYPSIIDLLVTNADWFFDREVDFYITLEPIINGESEDRMLERGNDSRGSDKASKTNEKEKNLMRNYSGGDTTDYSSGEMKRSHSINSLTDEPQTSPKPVVRRKNKSAAPGPPVVKEAKKQEEKNSVIQKSSRVKDTESAPDRPDKPPRPNVPAISTLPRPMKNNREHKSTETNKNDIMSQSTGSIGFLRNEKVAESNARHDQVTTRSKEKQMKSVNSVSTNTESCTRYHAGSGTAEETHRDRPVAAPRFLSTMTDAQENRRSLNNIKTIEYSKIDLTNVKKEWLLGKDSSDAESSTLKKPAIPERPPNLKSQALKMNRASLEKNLKNSYENVSISSNENLSSGSSDERTLKKTQMYSIDKQQVSIISVAADEKNKKGDNKGKPIEAEKSKVVADEESDNPPPESGLPTLPGVDKPERPPKPEGLTASLPSSHNQTLSDSNSISNNNDYNQNDNNMNKTSTGDVKHSSAPPPASVSLEPRFNTQSESESTDF